MVYNERDFFDSLLTISVELGDDTANCLAMELMLTAFLGCFASNIKITFR